MKAWARFKDSKQNHEWGNELIDHNSDDKAVPAALGMPKINLAASLKIYCYNICLYIHIILCDPHYLASYNGAAFFGGYLPACNESWSDQKQTKLEQIHSTVLSKQTMDFQITLVHGNMCL